MCHTGITLNIFIELTSLGDKSAVWLVTSLIYSVMTPPRSSRGYTPTSWHGIRPLGFISTFNIVSEKRRHWRNKYEYEFYVAVLCSVAMPMALLALDRNVQQALHCTAARSWIFSTLVILHLSQDHDSDSNCEFHCRYPLPYLRPPGCSWLSTD